MKLDRLGDWLAEPRLPHHAVRWLAEQRREARARRPVQPGEPVAIVVSVDVEQDLGSLGTPDRWETCYPFLDWLAAREWPTTLFVQGSIVEALAPRLRQLGPSHELGLHGYYHELWGRPLWFTTQDGTPIYLRRELLKEGIRAFERAGLPVPTAFRAPNLVCDRATLDLLCEAGFLLDSSDAAFRGCPPVPSRYRCLRRVPVGARPAPRLRRRFGLPTWAVYELLNMRSVLHAPESGLLALARDILGYQARVGAPPHLVLLAHPWEFADVGHPGCGVDNYARLVDRVALLADAFGGRVARLADVAAEDVVAEKGTP